MSLDIFDPEIFGKNNSAAGKNRNVNERKLIVSLSSFFENRMIQSRQSVQSRHGHCHSLFQRRRPDCCLFFHPVFDGSLDERHPRTEVVL